MKESKRRVRAILNEYYRGGLPDKLAEAIQGWLVSDYGEEKDEALKVLFFRDVNRSYRVSKDTLRSLKDMKRKLGWIARRINFRRRIIASSAAAVIFIALTIGGVAIWNNYVTPNTEANFIASHHVSVPQQEQKKLVLVDNTEVVLNENSKFSHDNARECRLEGEGYFKVARNEKPFVLHTGHVHITVLGTEFNVRVYPQSELTIVTLYSGSVALSYKQGEYKLLPGKEFIYNNITGEVTIRQVDIANGITKPSWLDNNEALRIYSLGEIFHSIEQKYGVIIENKQLSDTTQYYTFRLLDYEQSVDMIMSSLRVASGDFDYRIEGNRIIIERDKK